MIYAKCNSNWMRSLICLVCCFQYYQALFRDCQCFLHILSLLNGKLEEENDEKLVLIVLETLTCLLTNNDASKVFWFRCMLLALCYFISTIACIFIYMYIYKA